MADVILKLIIDGKEFDAKIKDADKQIGNLKKEVEKNSTAMTSSLKSVAGAMGLAFGAASVISFMKQSIQAYAEQEAALKKLEVALGRNAQGLSAYASELQKVTAFGDETILEAMAMLAMFTKNEDQIKMLTKATLDFAAAKGMDLVSAADLVAKTIGSEVNALGRYGIQVEGAVGSSERFSQTMYGLNKHFGGQAQAQLDTYAGKIKNIQERFGDVQKNLGEKLLPTVVWVSEALVQGIDNWESAFSKYFRKLSVDYKNFMALLGIDIDKLEMVSPHQVTAKLGKNLISPHQMKFAKENKDDENDEKEIKKIQKAGDALKEIEATARRFQHSTGGRGIIGVLFPADKETGAQGGKAPIKEMSETMKQSMGVIQDTTDAMWYHLIIGGRRAVNEWDAIWLAFRNSALQRIGEIVQAKIWDFLLGTLFSFIPGLGPVAGAITGTAASAVARTPSAMQKTISPKVNLNLNAKLIGEDIYLSNKRVTQRKADNST